MMEHQVRSPLCATPDNYSGDFLSHDVEPVRSILEHLRKTGKLILEGGGSDLQQSLPIEIKGDDNAWYYE